MTPCRSRPSVVLFDLDGTLVDTAPDLIAAVNVSLHFASLSPVGLSDVHGLVGRGARVMVQRAFALRGQALDPKTLDDHTARMLHHYSANIAVHSRPFPGVSSALSRLRDDGFSLAVCTNKQEALARKLLSELGLTDAFDAIVGGDSLEFRKPDPEHLTGTVARCGQGARACAMVGDSAADITAARAANLTSIVVDFGYSEMPVSKLGACAVISAFEELIPTLKRLGVYTT